MEFFVIVSPAMRQDKFIIFSSRKTQIDIEEQDDPHSSNGGDDRRRHERFRVGVLTEIEVTGHGAIPGITYNMSRSGALLLTMQQMLPGQKVLLNFISGDNRREIRSGRVVHDSHMTDNMFWSQKVGVEFTDGVPNFFVRELPGQQNTGGKIRHDRFL